MSQITAIIKKKQAKSIIRQENMQAEQHKISIASTEEFANVLIKNWNKTKWVWRKLKKKLTISNNQFLIKMRKKKQEVVILKIE